MKKIIVLISGSGSNLQAIIDQIKLNNINASIECVISNNEDAYGLIRAKESNINTQVIDHNNFDSREDFDQKLIYEIEKYKPDLVVLAGFMRILSPIITSKLIGKIINIHPSLLPKYGGEGMYGLNIHKKVIENNEVETGISIHYVSEEYDSGKIIFQKKIKVDKCDKPEKI